MSLGARSNNLFLATLPFDDYLLLRPHLHETTLRPGSYLQHAGDRIEQVVFPQTCLCCVAITTPDDRTTRCAIVGREGIVSPYVGFGVSYVIDDVLVHVGGEASYICVDAFRGALERSPLLRDRVARSEALLMAQTYRSMACNARHTVDRRLARWLLDLHDRNSGDTIELTQEALAELLGVKRTTVTETAKKLQADGIIAWHRGRVVVRQRERLETTACGCYRRFQQCAEQLLAEAPADVPATIPHLAPSQTNPVPVTEREA